jgi:hypothetical protein
MDMRAEGTTEFLKSLSGEERVMRNVVALAVLLQLTGCAFAGVSRPNPALYASSIPRESFFKASEAQVLDAAKSALEAMGYTIQTVNNDVGLVRTNPTAILIPANCDCGTWNLSPVSGTADSVLEVRTKVSASGLVTTAQLEHLCGAHFRGQNLYGATTRDETYRCASKGFAEKKFFETLSIVMEKRSSRASSGSGG